MLRLTSRSSWMLSLNSEVLRKREMALNHTAMIEDFYWQGISRMRYLLPLMLINLNVDDFAFF